MSIEKASDRVSVAKLSSDAQLSDELIHSIEHADTDSRDWVLDFSSIRYINSSHLAKLLKLRKILVGSDRRLVLCAVGANVMSVLHVTGLDKIFEFAPTSSDALAKLQQPRNA